MPVIERCGFTVEQGRRICDEPATHIYNGIGGRQPCCDRHTTYLRRVFGIRAMRLADEQRTANAR